MGEDRWNDRRYGDEPQWGDNRRREQPRASRGQDPGNYDRYDDDRGYARQAARSDSDDDTRYRPFGDNGPISTRSGAYTGEGRPEGRPYGASGRYDDLSPGYREFETSQRRIHRGDYDPDRYTPNPRESRGEEPRTWWDRTQDEVSSWFGDESARRRREWDERQADLHAERRVAGYSGFDESADRRGAASGLDYKTGQRGWGGLDYKGEHRGRGPKGYRRSDARIAEDLNDRLTDDPYVDASEIEVKVKDAEVTLEGFVTRREDKRRAEDLAETILGVGHVQNNLRLKPASSIPAGDYIVP
jgi:osmotically-inducible protein OsmY